MTEQRKPHRRPQRADRGEHDVGDRMWRELAGSGASQVSLSAALRARDADQPTAEEVAEAERSLVVQHRNWTPAKDA